MSDRPTHTKVDTTGTDTLEAASRDKTAGVVTCDACPVLCRIRPGRTGACDRYGNIGRRAHPHGPHGGDAQGHGCVGKCRSLRRRGRLGRHRAAPRGYLHHRDRFGNHVPGLQTRAVHRRGRASGHRHGDGRLRRNLQLLRPEGEDRHRPLRRTRDRTGFAAKESRWGTSPRPSTAHRCWRSEASGI